MTSTPAAVPDASTGRDALALLGDRIRPVTLAGERSLPVLEPLRSVLPDGGLGRGTVVTVDGPLARSLTFALVAEASGQGSWVALVGFESIGLLAAAELGVALDRVVLVDPPPGTVVSTLAALADAIDLLVVGPVRIRPSDARRLGARIRERGAVLIPTGTWWPEPADVVLSATGTWVGLGEGHGRLRARKVRVEATGRRRAARPRSVDLWLPGIDGEITLADEAQVRSLAERAG